MRRPMLYFVLALSVSIAPPLTAQTPASSGQTQVVQDPMRRAEPPSATASFDELVTRGDELRAEKAYLDALDYYRAALAKKANSASVYNRMGIVEMEVEHWRASEKELRSMKPPSTCATTRHPTTAIWGRRISLRRTSKKPQRPTPTLCSSIRTFLNTTRGPESLPVCPRRKTALTTTM